VKLYVLSRSAKVPSTKRLLAAARARDHKARVLNPSRIELELLKKKSRLSYEQKTIHAPDVLIPRIASSIAAWGLSLIEQFAHEGSLVMNSAKAIGVSQNALRCLQLLSSKGIDIPSTLVAHATDNLDERLEKVGGLPVLVKLLRTHEHGAVMVCETKQSLESSLEAVLGLKQSILLQEYVHTRSGDLRVFCVGGRALAAARRHARKGKLSLGLQKGAKLERIELYPELRDAAERAAKVCELEVCAVDLLETKGRHKVFEVNASPALPAMEQVCDIDLATAIIVRAEQLSKLPLRAAND
jgi:ribosomal protein S6--L-glutamate ligase